MARVHPLACVAPEATIADDVEIGPYCTVGPQVTLAAGCRLVGHVNITGNTRVGERTVIHNFASLGGPPQSLSYAGEATRLEIGADCTIREGVTMSIGTVAGGGVTRVGARGFFMAYAHVGHDCAVGDDVVMAHGAVLGGHCTVGNHVFVGGLTAVHQRVRIGTGAMLGGSSGLRADLIPFGTVLGVPADLIAVHGAVSESVARAMAEGALRASGAGLAIAVTGVAGPGGGSAEKPVGLVHFGLAIPGRTTHRVERFGDLGRERIRRETVRVALEMVLEAS